LILTNIGKTEGTPDEIATLQANLAALAAETNGWVVDLGADNRVSAAAQQAEANPACVYAKNLEAYAIKEIVDGFRELNPLEYIVLVGNDQAIPFFRYPDNSLLASEMGYSPPVKDNTTSQASLKSGYILTQDTYAADIEISTKAYMLPVPDLAIGRLVETASDINQVLLAYLATDNGIVYPTNALVTGYDFLEDVANAVRDELQAGLDSAVVDTLIMSNELSPEDPLAWTATDLQNSLLGSDHDLVFLAGHFSASSALAADYKTRLTTGDVLASTTNFTNSLIYSAGCHSGYNIVNAHDVLNVTEEPDWAQAFAAKGATFIGGTGYQYGDTEFIEYSERLYLEFTRQLRYGSGPVAVGDALAQAKLAYLANTPVMRGIHEKSLLEATLFGLPMLQVSLPFTTTAPIDLSIITSTSGFVTNPGLTLGLEYADVHLTSTVTETTITLDVISSSGGDPTQVIASYLAGPDGVVVNAAEPVMPLDMLNVTHPTNSDFVLRGIGWRRRRLHRPARPAAPDRRGHTRPARPAPRLLLGHLLPGAPVERQLLRCFEQPSRAYPPGVDASPVPLVVPRLADRHPAAVRRCGFPPVLQRKYQLLHYIGNDLDEHPGLICPAGYLSHHVDHQSGLAR
jgi:hypothetical protein